MTETSPPATTRAGAAATARRVPPRSRPARAPLAPSPVALALVSVFRHGRRVASRLIGRSLVLPLAAIVAIAVVGLWLPGPDARTAARESVAGLGTDATGRPDDASVTAATAADATVAGGRVTSSAANEGAGLAGTTSAAGSTALPAARAPSIVAAEPSAKPTEPTEPTEPTVPARLHERVVEEKRVLEARVAALEAETTALESEMLALDLQLVVLDSAAREAGVDPDAIGGDGTVASDVERSSPPLELGNATLVPPPLTELGERSGAPADEREPEPPPQTTAETFASSEPFLPEAAFDEELAFEDELAFDEELPPFAETASALAPPADDRGGGGRAAASASVGLPVERVVVAEVPYGSGADDAGLLPGDILVAIDGRPVNGFGDLDPYAASGDPAPLHELEVVRGGQRQWLDLAGSPAELALVTRWIDPARLALD